MKEKKEKRREGTFTDGGKEGRREGQMMKGGNEGGRS